MLYTNAIKLLSGIVLLIFGQRLFWLLVGLLGFFVGFAVAAKLLPGQPQMVHLVVGLILGILGAVLAVFLQKVAIGFAGFYAGYYLVTTMMVSFHWRFPQLEWLPAVVGGIIGAVFGIILFDWALILFSSLTGAGMVIESVHVPAEYTAFLFIGLVLLGIVIQASTRKGKPGHVARAR